jgi:hypothetical protein
MKNAVGDEIKMVPGDCLWCGQWVTSEREVAGATDPEDACWATEDGDFGCSDAPETCEEGCGSHARPYDLAIRLMKELPDELPNRWEDWCYAVANSDTMLGYEAWVKQEVLNERL